MGISSFRKNISVLAVGLALLFSASSANAAECVNCSGGWYASAGAGYWFMEGDEAFNGGGLYEIKVGNDLTPAYSIEGGVGLLPLLDARDNGPSDTDSKGIDFRFDVLYHLDQSTDRVFDPYLSLGGGIQLVDKTLQHGNGIWYAGPGFGFFYDLTESMFMRADYRLEVATQNSELHHSALASIGFRWGERFGRRSPQDTGLEGTEGGMGRVYFPFDSSALDDRARQTLQENAKWLAENSNVDVEVQGHCDERGTVEYNLALGQRRANSAYQYLRGLGVEDQRMSTVSYGEDRPADPGQNEAAWAKNRRVQFSITGTR